MRCAHRFIPFDPPPLPSPPLPHRSPSPLSLSLFPRRPRRGKNRRGLVVSSTESSSLCLSLSLSLSRRDTRRSCGRAARRDFTCHRRERRCTVEIKLGCLAGSRPCREESRPEWIGSWLEASEAREVEHISPRVASEFVKFIDTRYTGSVGACVPAT